VDSVNNLSSHTLTHAEKQLLSLGLSFIPTNNKLPLTSIETAMDRLTRGLKLKDFFGPRGDYDPDAFKHKFMKPSEWTPKNRDISESTYALIQRIETRTTQILKKYKNLNGYVYTGETNTNLPSTMRQALRALKTNKNIVIKPADKGAMTCIMDKTAYINEAHRQLHQPMYYTPITLPRKQILCDTINPCLTALHTRRLITYRQWTYLTARMKDKDRKFYLLPKVHKPNTKWPQANMPEGRPIVSDCGTESKRASELIDHFIKPLAIKHPSYLKDTYDFLEKIRNKVIHKDHILVTGDVTALYTNMCITRTLNILRRELALNPQRNRPDEEIMTLLTTIMTNNDFTFNDELYLQVFGTAMGKTFAPNLANLYLMDLDKEAMDGFRIKPYLFFRFLDDIFFVWPGTREDLDEYQDFLNAQIPNIKITLNISDTQVDFLDTTIFKHTTWRDTTLQSKVFFKATDTHQLLHTTSFHPPHTARGIVKSQIIRYKRLCSYREDFDEACTTLFHALSKRGYNRRDLRKTKHDIWHNYNRKVRTDNDRLIIPIVIPYSTLSTRLVREWKKLIQEAPQFQMYRTIAAYCKHKNLKQLLTRAALD